ncbi:MULTISPECIES: hypothetical protein [unclassified Sphingomonas]|nr:hypothetical protein [Sphingomonas sp. FARSPH]
MAAASAGILIAASGGSAAIAVAQTSPSPAGTWRGGFIGSDFTFELKQSASGWTGRYTSAKAGKWADLQAVSVVANEVRFKFESQPPSAFVLTLDPTGRTLTGTATFGDHPPLPLTLTRAS